MSSTEVARDGETAEPRRDPLRHTEADPETPGTAQPDEDETAETETDDDDGA